MAKDKTPMTQAIRTLKALGVAFTPRLYRYEDKGGTRTASRELGVDEHLVVKTLVFEDEAGQTLLMLMHGDREVSTRSLARALGRKSVSPCDPAKAEKHTGYQVGGISPFGTRAKLPVFVEGSILDLPVIYINGGKRGLLLEMVPGDAVRSLEATPVSASV